MKLLRVTDIQRGCVYDGSGVRTTVFLKGCPLHCPWCCNPETQDASEDWYVDNDKCLLNKGITSRLCANCERNSGKISIHECPFGVATKTSVDYSSTELLNLLRKEKDLFTLTNGGVTFSGGEPLLQAESLAILMRALKEDGIDIALETTLMTSENNLMMTKPYIDTYIIDVKLQPQMYLGKEEYLIKIREGVKLLDMKEKIYRLVFVNKMLNRKFEVLSSLQWLGIDNIEILLCHNLGLKKYAKMLQLNRNYTADNNLAKDFELFLNQNGVRTNSLTV